MPVSAAGETDQVQRSKRAQSVDELAARGREKADALKQEPEE